MTDDARLAALEAVAEAATQWLRVVSNMPLQNQEEGDAMDACEKALMALRALPAPQPAGETVTLAVWEDKRDGGVMTMRAGDACEQHYAKFCHWRRLGTTTLRLDPQP